MSRTPLNFFEDFSLQWANICLFECSGRRCIPMDDELLLSQREMITMKKCALIRTKGLLTKSVGLGLTVSLAMGVAASAAVVWTDNFDSYAAGTYLNGQGGWTDTGGNNYQFVAAGVNGTGGVNQGGGSNQMTWTGHAWDWGTTVAVGESVVVGMDFQANGSGVFDDDRVGWVSSAGTSSSYHFGVQLDNTDNGAPSGLVTYFRDNGGGRTGGATLIPWATLSSTGSNWYREQLTVKKLTSGLGAGGAEMSVAFWALDGSGNPVGSPLTASMTLDTSALRGFSGTVYPMFKNYSSTTGNADNAYFAIIPETGSWSLLAVGALALGARRRRA
jgi:hypothetical protein